MLPFNYPNVLDGGKNLCLKMRKSFLAFGSYFEAGDQGGLWNVLQITLENKTLLASVILQTASRRGVGSCPFAILFSWDIMKMVFYELHFQCSQSLLGEEGGGSLVSNSQDPPSPVPGIILGDSVNWNLKFQFAASPLRLRLGFITWNWSQSSSWSVGENVYSSACQCTNANQRDSK